ncbi:NAD(P)-binding protein [Nemania sp. FL0916]|nr:NAD(P)-binding protein [Nemania sp. FL0916]
MAPERQRYALITGCGRGGIGEALAKTYMRRGISPIATVLPSEYSQHLSDANITWFNLDVTSDESVRDLKARVMEHTGGDLDFLVNNAGICYTMPATDTDVAAAQNMFNVNVFGPMRMVHSFHDMIIGSKGTIVNIGSIGGIIPYVYGSSYNATKAALHHWSSTLRVEMAPFDVKVLTIISGEVGTNFLQTDRNRELPKDSYYLPLATEFKEHVKRVPETVDRFIYAEKVVSTSLRSSPPAWFWFGHASFLARLIDAFAPRKFWDWLLWGMFKFDKLKSAHQKRRE